MVTGAGRRSGRETKCCVAKLCAPLDAQPEPSRARASAAAPPTTAVATRLPIARRLQLRPELLRHLPVGISRLGPGVRLLQERDRFLGPAERTQRPPYAEARFLTDARVARLVLPRLERGAAARERLLVEALLPLPVPEI